MSLEAERIFAALAAHQVDYVLVGGLAVLVLVHGHVRVTRDVDLIPDPTTRNLRRLADALNELDARVLNPGSEGLAVNARMLPRANPWQFADLRHRALELALGAVCVAVASRDDLISMKRAAARPVDLDDISALTAPEHGEV